MNMASQPSSASDAPDTTDLAGTDEDSLEQTHAARMGLSTSSNNVIPDSGSGSGGSSSQAALLRGSGFSVGSSGANPLPSAGISPPPADVQPEEDDSQGRELLPVRTSDPESMEASNSNRKIRSQSLRKLARTLAPVGPKGPPGGQGSADVLHASNAGGQEHQPLMYLFSGHDSTITPLLASEFA